MLKNYTNASLALVLLGLPLSLGTLAVSAETSDSTSGKNPEATNTSQLFAEIQRDTINSSNSNQANSVAQNVTSVSQLSDVRSTDWAFTALH